MDAGTESVDLGCITFCLSIEAGIGRPLIFMTSQSEIVTAHSLCGKRADSSIS